MNIPAFLKNWICTAVSHRMGGIITSAAGAIVGGICAALTRYLHLTLAPDEQTQLDSALVLGGTTLANGLLQSWKAGNAKALQEALGVVPDGYIGPVTIRRATLASPSEVAAAEQPDNSRPSSVFNQPGMR